MQPISAFTSWSLLTLGVACRTFKCPLLSKKTCKNYGSNSYFFNMSEELVQVKGLKEEIKERQVKIYHLGILEICTMNTFHLIFGYTEYHYTNHLSNILFP